MFEYEVFGTSAELVWQEINLADIDYDRRHETIKEIPNGYRIYIFHRRFGDTSEALYIGKSKNLKNRIMQELNALPLIEHVKGAKKGRNCYPSRRSLPMETAIKINISTILKAF